MLYIFNEVVDMLSFIGQLGSWGPVLLLLTLANLVLVIRYGVKLFGKDPDGSVDINQIMIVAMLVFAIGAFSHYSGLYSGLQIYGDMSPAMFAKGYAVSLIAMMFGCVVFIFSTICWLGLRMRLQRVSIASKIQSTIHA